MTRTLSPMGWFYRFTPDAPAGERLTRKRHLEQPWTSGKLQTMSADELRFVASVIDEGRAGE